MNRHLDFLTDFLVFGIIFGVGAVIIGMVANSWGISIFAAWAASMGISFGVVLAAVGVVGLYHCTADWIRGFLGGGRRG